MKKNEKCMTSLQKQIALFSLAFSSLFLFFPRLWFFFMVSMVYGYAILKVNSGIGCRYRKNIERLNIDE